MRLAVKPQKVALITGGGSGLGSDIALKFLERGYCVVISYNESVQSNKKFLESTRDHSDAKVLSIKAELTRENDREKLVDVALSKFGAIDVLVNNAGLGGAQASIDEIAEKDWDEMMGVNLKVPFFLSRRVAKIMHERGRGKIINIMSIVGLRQFQALKGGIHYSVSKAALAHLTRSMALLYAPKVQINAISLGYMEHRMMAGRQKQGERTPEMVRDLLKMIPAGRFGQSRELAELCIFLCSAEADYITGQIVGMDGGMSLV